MTESGKLMRRVFGAAGLLAAEGGDGVGAGDGRAHAGEFELVFLDAGEG
jgi:hypothetical protein